MTAAPVSPPLHAGGHAPAWPRSLAAPHHHAGAIGAAGTIGAAAGNEILSDPFYTAAELKKT